MKRMKKIFAVILSLAMVMGMSLTAFAKVNTTSPHIKITDLPKEVTVKYKKIVEPANATADNKTGWQSVKVGENPILNDNQIKVLLDASNKGNTSAENGTINSDVESLETVLEGITLDAANADKDGFVNDDYIIGDVTPGLYVIEAQCTGYTFIRMLAFVDFADRATGTAVNETSVTAKGEKLQVGKVIDETDGKSTSVASGDVVPFKVTAKYPYYDSNTTAQKFIISDKVTGGSITDDGISIQIGTDAAVNVKKDSAVDNNNYTVSWNTEDKTFEVTFKYNAANAGKDVVITYNVTAVLTTTIDKLTNEVTSTTTLPKNHPDNNTGSEKDTTTEAKVITPSTTAEVVKVEENNANKTLSGAKFTLYVVVNKKSDATKYLTTESKIADIPDDKEDTTGNEKWLKEVKESDATGTDGKATFISLDAQEKYYVVETQAPTGYSLNETAYELTGATVKAGTPTPDENGVMVTENKVEGSFNKIVGSENANISDTKLSSLPSTGGIGTTIFTIGGCAIMIIAAALFFASRRKSAK